MTDIKWPPTHDVSIIGTKFGKRTVVSFVDKTKKGYRYVFKCECGDERILPLSLVKRGLSGSCFTCMRAEVKKEHVKRKKNWFDLMGKPEEFKKLVE